VGQVRLREAHARPSHQPELDYHLAIALFELGNVAEAESLFVRALEYNSVFAGREHAKQTPITLKNEEAIGEVETTSPDG
tara:strand:- start:636 stop:875 length:240 start_codon:yes stop_codon:yes gene_type:complete